MSRRQLYVGTDSSRYSAPTRAPPLSWGTASICRGKGNFNAMIRPLNQTLVISFHVHVHFICSRHHITAGLEKCLARVRPTVSYNGTDSNALSSNLSPLSTRCLGVPSNFYPQSFNAQAVAPPSLLWHRPCVVQPSSSRHSHALVCPAALVRLSCISTPLIVVLTKRKRTDVVVCCY